MEMNSINSDDGSKNGNKILVYGIHDKLSQNIQCTKVSVNKIS